MRRKALAAAQEAVRRGAGAGGAQAQGLKRKPDVAAEGRATKKAAFAADGAVGAKAAAGADEGPMCFLFKSEPDDRIDAQGINHKFSIDCLAAEKDQTTLWDGVRNHEAKNVMLSCKCGDRGFFYHSNCKQPGIVGLVSVVREAYPDPTQFDRTSCYFDPKATASKPRWFCVDVRLDRKLKRLISLEELKTMKGKELAGMQLLERGRLSVQKVSSAHFERILGMEDDGSV